MKQSNNLTMEKGSFHLPHWIVILLLIFIPPVAWWHMWKNHRYHTWFPYVLWLNAAVMFGFAAYVIVHFYPLLTTFYDSATYIFASHIGLLLFAIFEIIFGFYLVKMFKNEAMLRRKILAVVIVLLFLNTIAIPLSQLIITSNLKNQIKTNTNTVVANQISDPTTTWKTHKNTIYGFSLMYPQELVNYVSELNNGLIIGYPGPADRSLFSVQAYKTELLPKEWWNTVGKFQNKQIFNTAFNDIAIPSKQNSSYSEIKGIEVIGQRKTPGGATFSTSLILIPHNSFIYVVEDNTQDYKYQTEEKINQILSTFKFLDGEK